MFFSVSGLLQEPVGSKRKHELGPQAPLLHATVELVRLTHAALVRLSGEVAIDTICSRCLAPFSYVAPLQFEEIFVQQVDVATGAKVDSEEGDEESFAIGLDHTIDITEAVRQYTEMAAAMQPLCQPECPGLCAKCGQDLTLGACACDRTPLDSRWAALAELRLRSNG